MDLKKTGITAEAQRRGENFQQHSAEAVVNPEAL
jgi:hypothetical protein